jgi:anhydro-N-acetylmuramic acid kinase
MDGIDAVLVDFSTATPTLIATHSHQLPNQLEQQLKILCSSGNHEIDLMGRCDRWVARVFADAVNQLLVASGYKASDIIAIGSHGQTIRHYPDGDNGFSLQIGDANTLAVLTGIDVIADFRRKDIALGGQGAPLVPAFHQAVFASSEFDRIILNIGGMANLTLLPKDQDNPLLGLDTGPGNVLLDEWCKKNTGKSYDKDAFFARSGQANKELLSQFLKFDYFKTLPPKSTGRETFNLDWIEQQLSVFEAPITEPDVQATLVELTAQSVALEVLHLVEGGELFVCGGGAHNPEIMRNLNLFLPNFRVSTTAELGIDADWVEGVAFAWLAYAYKNDIPGNIPAVTGASRKAILGGYYPTN